AVAYGTPFIANPDLVNRFKFNAELATPDKGTYYTNEANGYTDYPTMDELLRKAA
ncbi:MAG: alkene reductase, partial [Proteobacteria bacterium]|nr:alkene reductase [Pseudomonadota bacterium]